MPWFDILILAIIVISTLLSIIRGFAKDAISLSAWILAFILAISLADKLAIILPQSIEQPQLRVGIAMTVLFIITLVMGMVANFLLSGFINMVRLNNLDRSLGALFGFIRGVIIICLIAVIGAFIGLNEISWWSDASLLPYAEKLIKLLMPYLPQGVVQYIKL